MVEEDVMRGGVEILSCDEWVTASYPDSPSTNIISGDPSTESRRDRVVAETLGSSQPLPVAPSAPELLLIVPSARSEW